VPSPSPPAVVSQSPYAAHVKGVPVPVPITVPIPPAGDRHNRPGSPAVSGGRPTGDPYAQPLPLSPVSDSEVGANGRFRSDSQGSEARFHFPPAPRAPAISSFSTLSGWAGDFSASPPSSAGSTVGAFSFAQAHAQGQDQGQGQASAGGLPFGGAIMSGEGSLNAVASGSGEGSGTPPPRTSGWYQPPGSEWENSIQGQPVATEMAAGAGGGDAWASGSVNASGSFSGSGEGGYGVLKAPWLSPGTVSTQEWPRGDVEMYDAGAGAGHGVWGPQR
jgi:hypothetical protein